MQIEMEILKLEDDKVLQQDQLEALKDVVETQPYTHQEIDLF